MKTWEELTKRSAALQDVINELLQRHSALQSFFDAQEWDKDAQAIIDLLQGFQEDLANYREEQVSLQTRSEQEHMSLTGVDFTSHGRTYVYQS